MGNQSYLIKNAIFNCITREGMTDKKEIYDKVCETLDVPRPTVRRACQTLEKDLIHVLNVLQKPGRKR